MDVVSIRTEGALATDSAPEGLWVDADEAPGRRRGPVPLVRLAAAAALAVTAAAHIGVAVEHLAEVHYLGLAFVGFVLLTAAGAGSLLVEDRLLVWAAMGALNLAAVVAFVVSRMFGLPGAADDRGDWTNGTALVCVAAELVVVALAVLTLRRRRPTRSPAESS